MDVLSGMSSKRTQPAASSDPNAISATTLAVGIVLATALPVLVALAVAAVVAMGALL